MSDFDNFFKLFEVNNNNVTCVLPESQWVKSVVFIRDPDGFKFVQENTNTKNNYLLTSDHLHLGPYKTLKNAKTGYLNNVKKSLVYFDSEGKEIIRKEFKIVWYACDDPVHGLNKIEYSR
jgi:hypothetical protein